MTSAFLAASHSPLMRPDDNSGEPGAAFHAAVARARTAAQAFDPELVVFFGPDHRRALTSVVPPFTVVRSAAGFGDWDLPNAPYAVDDALARTLVGDLHHAGFDVALGEGVRLDHGFAQTWTQLFGSLDAKPVIPIVINCVVEPLPAIARTIAFGRAVGAALAPRRRRTLFIGSGGLSHDPPSLGPEVTGLPETERKRMVEASVADAATRIRPDWDRRFLAALSSADWAWLENLATADVYRNGCGAQEIRTWLAAYAAAGVPVAWSSYHAVPEWITGMGVAMSGG
jgi:2,3-dihydroxyphenylpropionate 1,2-dioxygenase